LVANDPNDPNTLTPEIHLVATAVKDTLVCCWQDTPDELFVDQNAPDGGDGLGWDTAFNDLQDALEYARSAVCGNVSLINVAQGSYSPGSDEGDSFILPPNISLVAGFPTGGCDPNLRDPKKYVTTLTGKIDDTRRNDTVLVLGNNTYIEGFTITEASRFGQGIYGCCGDFSVINCKIDQNYGYGAFIEDANATFKWCNFFGNKIDGIRHTGEDYSLYLENVWVRQSGQFGVYCLNSTPVVLNSILSESDMAQEGRAGIMMVNPVDQPVLFNCTIAHNRAVGVAKVGNRLPEIQNCIVYHNGGSALAGFSADQAAFYSCIEDCNSVNNNISSDPMFAYFDPNNVRITASSPCHDSGFTLSENYTQVDMDNRDRVLGNAVDRGAYEIECADSTNSYDMDADGLVNLHEFNGLSKAWLGHDPNDPAWLANPNLADPNQSEGWYEWKYKHNFEPTGNSQYSIDVADLMTFLEDAPWLWRACWMTDEELAAMTSSEQVSALSNVVQTEAVSTAVLLSSSTVSTVDVIGTKGIQAVSESVAEPELSVEEQIADLQDSIELLESIWNEDADIQQIIDPNDWQQFMDSVSQSLLELETGTVEIE
jgi:hypothetical protein